MMRLLSTLVEIVSDAYRMMEENKERYNRFY